MLLPRLPLVIFITICLPSSSLVIPSKYVILSKRPLSVSTCARSSSTNKVDTISNFLDNESTKQEFDNRKMIPIHLNRKKLDRRKFLACITTIGTGVVIGGADVKASELKKIDPISNKILMTNSMLSQNAPNLYKSFDFRYFVAGGGCAAFSHG